MEITINVADVLVWFVGCLIIDNLLPKEYQEELGSLIGGFVFVVWTVLCIVFLLFCGYDVVPPIVRV